MISTNIISILLLVSLTSAPLVIAGAQQQPGASTQEKKFISVSKHTQEDDDRILKLYEGLRVADVSDGMDMAGLQDVGLMDPDIKPLWRDVEGFQHVITGLAVTVRYVPTNKRPDKMNATEFRQWEGRWYREISPEPFVPLLRQGSIIVIDGEQDRDTGSIGSNNSLTWKSKGARGIVTSGGARDTDELIKQKIPLYLKKIGRGIRPGRNEVESVNQPVMCGGVLVRPGDVVVADGDGVVVVPREHAEEVAKCGAGDSPGRQSGPPKTVSAARNSLGQNGGALKGT